MVLSICMKYMLMYYTMLSFRSQRGANPGDFFANLRRLATVTSIKVPINQPAFTRCDVIVLSGILECVQ